MKKKIVQVEINSKDMKKLIEVCSNIINNSEVGFNPVKVGKEKAIIQLSG